MDQNKLNEVNELMARNQVGEADEAVSSETTEEAADGAVVTEAAASAPAPKPPVQAGESALGTYRKNARKFALLGLTGCVLGLATLLLLQQQNNPLMILAAVVMLCGALFMVTGMSALRPDGMVRAFAQVAALQPTTAQMQDLLDAVKGLRGGALHPQVKQQVLSAVARYRGFEGYDEAIAAEIEEIIQHTRKRGII
mgnify:CR=1 FL=1